MTCGKVVGDASQLLTIRASEKNVDLYFRVDPSVPETLAGDPGRVRQVIVNLLGNAVKFTENGEVFVDVSLEQLTNGKAVLHCAVQDTGIGIRGRQAGLPVRVVQPSRPLDHPAIRRHRIGIGHLGEIGQLDAGKNMGGKRGRQGNASSISPPNSARLEMNKRPSGKSPPNSKRRRCCWWPIILGIGLSTRNRCRDTAYGRRPYPTKNRRLDEIVRAARAKTPFRLAVLDASSALLDCWALIGHIREKQTQPECAIIVLIKAGQAGIPDHYRHLPGIQFLTKPAKYSELFAAAASLLADGDQQHEVKKKVEKDTRPLHILMADDGLVNQEVAVGLLEMQGHTIEVANNGREAVEAAERQQFDLVLMDLEMPEMDGMEATTKIREMEKDTGRRTPVVAMTAHAVKGYRERCIISGMDDFITKPIKPEELFRTIRKAADEALGVY